MRGQALDRQETRDKVESRLRRGLDCAPYERTLTVGRGAEWRGRWGGCVIMLSSWMFSTIARTSSSFRLTYRSCVFRRTLESCCIVCKHRCHDDLAGFRGCDEEGGGVWVRAKYYLTGELITDAIYIWCLRKSRFRYRLDNLDGDLLTPIFLW